MVTAKKRSRAKRVRKVVIIACYLVVVASMVLSMAGPGMLK